MLGCDSFDMARIVASNLRRNSGDSAISGRTSLTVTARPTSVSSASAISVVAPAETIRSTR
jgi:hypothetical protein